ncbi:MAG: hypothetical protein Q8O42_12445 [Acidobacteriota bacterium]|nr:hypothetical protein [Acidobacteriota bacterium]
MNVARSLGLTLALAVVAMCATLSAHERKEVAGLNVVFGAEPEPALTGEMQFLRWRFTAQDKTPFADLEEIKATVKRDGKTHGPFTGRLTARDPGLVATQHIFTAAGEYETTLTFRKKGDATVHSVTFTFKIADRKTIEIP